MDSSESSAGERPIPSPFQRQALWSALTAISVVVIGAIAVGLVMLGTTVLSYLQPVLVPLAVAGIIAYLLDPVIVQLQKWGLSHQGAMLTVFIGFLLSVVGLIVAVVVPAVGQGVDIYKEWDTYQTRAITLVKEGISSVQTQINGGVAEEYYNKGVDWITREGPQLSAKLGTWILSRLQGAFGFFGYILGLFLVPIYLFYFLREGHKISQTWADYIPLRASQLKDEVVGTLTEVNGYLISFFRGQMVVSLIDGVLVAIALSAINLPYALLIGVFLAILGLIPYIGNLLVMIPAILISVAHFGASAWGKVVVPGSAVVGEVAKVQLEGKSKPVSQIVTEISPDGLSAEVLIHAWDFMPHVWAYPLMVLLIFVTLQQVNGLVTAPRIVGDSVGLHPLTVIFSVLFWSLLLGGLLGALLAVPLTAAIKVLFRRYIWERRIEPNVGRHREGEASPVEGASVEGDAPPEVPLPV
jgi:predicted PurR-regulated permease PerM